MNLIAPQSYWDATPSARAEHCNGCGPAGHRDFIPDNVLGVNLKPACDIHDWMYTFGHSKAEADAYFLANSMILCAEGSAWLFPIRAFIAARYYLAVRLFGQDAWEAGQREGAKA